MKKQPEAIVITSSRRRNSEIPGYGCVQTSSDTGVVLVRAGKEIAQMLWKLMLQHTKYPTSVQYSTISKKLVAKNSKLKDTPGSSHVSLVYYVNACMFAQHALTYSMHMCRSIGESFTFTSVHVYIQGRDP